jgi:hypothetical protein
MINHRPDPLTSFGLMTLAPSSAAPLDGSHSKNAVAAMRAICDLMNWALVTARRAATVATATDGVTGPDV